MQKSRHIESVGIVGAGVSGLVACKELKEAGIRCQVFEASQNFGGVFAQKFEGARLTSSNLTTAFSDFPQDEDRGVIWTFDEYLDYLGRYVAHFQLEDSLLFGARVTRIDQTDRWELTVDSGGVESSHAFDAVMVASGVHRVPNMPRWKGAGSFTGEMLHSSRFRSSAPFVGKRVVVVGGGESAADIALLVSRVASASCISIRGRTGHIVPRNLSEISAQFPDSDASDMDSCRAHHSLPHWYGPVLASRNGNMILKHAVQSGLEVNQVLSRINLCDPNSSSQTKFGTKSAGFCQAIANHGCLKKPAIREIRGPVVEFEDGSTFECDAIICATGFENRFEFLERSLPEVAAAALRPRSTLYKHCIYPETGSTLFFMGLARPAFGAIPPIAEMQARWFALLCTGAVSLPPRSQMEQAIKDDDKEARAQFPDDAERLRSLTDYLRMMDELATLIGCRPTGWLVKDPRLWWRQMLCPIGGSQYRLAGPQAKPDIAKRTLLAMPVRRANVAYLRKMILFWALSRFPMFKRYRPAATWR